MKEMYKQRIEKDLAERIDNDKKVMVRDVRNEIISFGGVKGYTKSELDEALKKFRDAGIEGVVGYSYKELEEAFEKNFDTRFSFIDDKAEGWDYLISEEGDTYADKYGNQYKIDSIERW